MKKASAQESRDGLKKSEKQRKRPEKPHYIQNPKIQRINKWHDCVSVPNVIYDQIVVEFAIQTDSRPKSIHTDKLTVK